MLFTISGLDAQSEFTSYGNTGSYQITKESNVGPLRGYDVYRPSTLSASGELHPVITWGNGTGASNETYNSFLKHLASYGFIVVASHSGSVGSGSQMIDGISWLLEENGKSSSDYYKKINPNRIGATGHSQGGAGTINTAHDDERVTCIAPLAPATFSYPYFYSTSGIECPIFIMVGANDGLANPNSVYSVSYRSATTTAIYGELRGNNHFDLTGDIGDFRKYVTAWFVANLWKDNSAEGLFFVEDAPIYSDRSFSQIESKNLDQYDMGDDDGDNSENIALGANVATSFVNNNCSLDALNDGYEPSDSEDDSHGIYGNYDYNNLVWLVYRNSEYEYVEYSWSTQQKIKSTDVYWYDGSYYSAPTNAYISYWDGTNWIKGSSISTTTDQWNTLSLNITTDKLRLYMYNYTSPTGVIEWKVNGTTDTRLKSSFSAIEKYPDFNSKLINNYPNPFDNKTIIEYNLSESNYTKLDVYDLMGKHIKSLVNDCQEAGNYKVTFYRQELPGGVYFYVLDSGTGKQVGKMILK
jgi:hypothetical protein